jgi:acyl-CoA hydrolase
MNVVSTAPGLADVVASAKNIYVSACAAEIPGLSTLFRSHPPRQATVTGIFSPVVNRGSYADPEIGLRVRSFFLNRALREHLAAGLVDYCPWPYRLIDRWLSAPGRFDTALVMLSTPDEQNKCSLGVQADFLPGFVGHIGRIVGFINPQMPHTQGDTLIDFDALAVTVDCDVPLVNITLKESDEAVISIARRIADLVRNNATVQFGLGQIPSQVLAKLGDHRGLRIHTGVIDDNVLSLEARGALSKDLPVVTGTAVGTARLYEAVSDRKRFSFRAVSHTHAIRTVARLRGFTAINSVLQVDLLGQMSAETSGTGLVASPGGLPDFVRGALQSEDGSSIIAVRARAAEGRPAGIVSQLGAPALVTVGAGDADIIVTEFGSAHIRYLSMDKRAEAIISIAAPEDRAALESSWAKMRKTLVYKR